MSLSFRVFSLPRSGSAWAANWLTDCHSICWHDPLLDARPEDIQKWAERQHRKAGISCTGSWMFEDKDWEVPTICLMRPENEINLSLYRHSLPNIPKRMIQAFEDLPFMKVTLGDLLDPESAEEIYGYLVPRTPFDRDRHKMLAQMNVQCGSLRMNKARRMSHAVNSQRYQEI